MHVKKSDYQKIELYEKIFVENKFLDQKNVCGNRIFSKMYEHFRKISLAR